MNVKYRKNSEICVFGNVKRKYMNILLYIFMKYAKMYAVALYPSQRPPVSKKGLKILLRAYR